MPGCFADTTGLTARTCKLVNNTRAKPARDRVRGYGIFENWLLRRGGPISEVVAKEVRLYNDNINGTHSEVSVADCVFFLFFLEPHPSYQIQGARQSSSSAMDFMKKLISLLAETSK